MSERLAFLDEGACQTRGVVTLDGLPERLFLERVGDDPTLRLGARVRARVAKVEPAFGAFLDLGGSEAFLPIRAGEVRPREGEGLAVEIRTEPRVGKLATARLIGPDPGQPGLLEPARPLAQRLSEFTKGRAAVTGREARAVADEAEAEALAVVHSLTGGGSIAVEPTRALTAIDVDVGDRKGADAKRVTRAANLAAIMAAARLLRLKGLGGLVVIDLAGRGHDGAALLTAARTAFAPDDPGVAMGPVTRFGTLELAVPRRAAGVLERLVGPEAVAHRLMRRLEAEPGGARLTGMAAPDVVRAAQALSVTLAERIGVRFTFEARPEFSPERFEVVTR
jgi:hypothetical protein